MDGTAAPEFAGTERFEVRRRIGSGGMGVVYHAFDRERDIDVALKTVDRIDPRAIYLLKREFRSLADLSHPNLIRLHELFSAEGQWFFTMELVDGVDFLSYVWGRISQTDARTLPVEQAWFEAAAPPPTTTAGTAASLSPEAIARLRGCLRQLAEGVLTLHGADKLHRDIKPPNVLVATTGRVVLLDFGLSADRERGDSGASMENLVVGTADYMSPEQAASKPLTPASDWYSVGVMIFEALTGRVPFSGRPLEILLAKQGAAPPPPSASVPDLPADLDALCSELLRVDPDARPSGASVVARLGGGAVSVAARRTSSGRAPPFVGREAELGELRRAFEETRLGYAAIAHVRGGSGIGKTHLVRRFLQELAAEEAATVLRGRCYECESVPYKALDSLVDSLSRHLTLIPREQALAALPEDMLALVRLFPVLRRVEAATFQPWRPLDARSPQELRRRASLALSELLQRLAEQRPVVIHLDDLQWGDVDSASLLEDLLSAEPPAVLLLASYRTEDAEHSPLLQALLRPPPSGLPRRLLVHFVELEQLSADESRDLAAQLVKGDPVLAAKQDILARESGGNPFFLRELVRYFGAEGSTAAGEQRLTLDEVLRRRLERLEPPARRLMDYVAAAGGPVPQRVLLRAAALTGKAGTALAELRLLHLVHTRGAQGQDDVECYHDRIRETVLRRLEPQQARECHLRLALALDAEGGADPEALAIHFQLAGEQEKAAEFAERAATAAAGALAFDRAARLYRLVLGLQPRRPGRRARELRVLLAEALVNAGRGVEAAEAFAQAAQEAPAMEALAMRCRAAEQLLWSGHYDEGLSELRRLQSELGLGYPATPRRALAALLWSRLRLHLRGGRFQVRDSSQIPPETLARIDLCWSLVLGLGFVDPIRSAALQAQHELLAHRAGEPLRFASSLCIRAINDASAGSRLAATAQRRVAQAAILAEQLDDPAAQGMVQFSAAVCALLEGRWGVAVEIGRRAEAILRSCSAGMAWQLNQVQLLYIWCHFYLGSIAELRRLVPELLKEARERGNLYLTTYLLTGTANIIWLVDDATDEAERAALEAHGRWSTRGYHMQHYDHLYALGQIELYRGEGAAIHERLRRGWRELARSLILRVQMVHIEALHLRGRCALQAATACRAPREARRLRAAVVRDARRIDRQGAPWGRPLADLLRAGVACAHGADVLAAELLRQAERGFVASDMQLYAAAARWRLGELVGGDEGGALCRSSEQTMIEQSVKAPQRMLRMLAPGFERDAPAG